MYIRIFSKVPWLLLSYYCGCLRPLWPMFHSSEGKPWKSCLWAIGISQWHCVSDELDSGLRKILFFMLYVWLIYQCMTESPVWRERLNVLAIYYTSWFILTEKPLWMGFTDKIFIDWPVSCFLCVGFVRYGMNVEGGRRGCLERSEYWMKTRLVSCLCG